MGRSIVDYIIEKRVEEAKKLILLDTMSLRIISDTVGFSDYNYFARTFKKRSGYTPLEYKKKFTSKINR
jgi:two-component system response regulator YesN